ncbi:MAG: hypothetical protein ACI90V_006205, partial [Bacillariaceae sp.]
QTITPRSSTAPFSNSSIWLDYTVSHFSPSVAKTIETNFTLQLLF